MDIALLAYRGDPPPDGTLERAQYYMCARLYQLHERGKLPKSNAANLKRMVLNFENLRRETQRELLDSFLKSWGKEGLHGFKTEIKSISKLYLKEKLI